MKAGGLEPLVAGASAAGAGGDGIEEEVVRRVLPLMVVTGSLHLPPSNHRRSTVHFFLPPLLFPQKETIRRIFFPPAPPPLPMDRREVAGEEGERGETGRGERRSLGGYLLVKPTRKISRSDGNI